jgi:dTDP-4-dehydrorhamnose 3,5-epimerase
MKFSELALQGSYLIEIEQHKDNRGFFARTFCQDEFAKHNINMKIAQCNVSYNASKGTIRGLHFQIPPYEESKIVRCTRGAIFDVIVDIRQSSPTFCHWASAILTEQNYQAVYVPPGFAHGFQTIEEHTEVWYEMSTTYNPAAARGLRWNDPLLRIDWLLPQNQLTISARDASFPDLRQVLDELSHDDLPKDL